MLCYVQLISLCQDARLLDLLYFPYRGLVPSNIKYKVKYWTHGNTEHIQTKNLDDCIHQLDQMKVNYVEIAYKATPHVISGSNLTILKVASKLNISPTSSIWEPTTHYKAAQRKDERIRMSLESNEISAGISSSLYPSLLEIYIDFDSSSNKDESLSMMHQLIASCIDQRVVNILSAGCADLLEGSGADRQFNILDEVASRINDYSILGERFDKLHSVLIGSLTTCREIKNLFASQSKVVLLEIPDSSRGSNLLGCLKISDSVLSKKISEKLVQPYLISEPLSGENSTKSSNSGEFEIGSSRIKVFTEKRWRELAAQGAFPYLQDYERLVHVIQPKYCFMIDIHPDNMIVNFLSAEIAVELEHLIDAYFLELPVDIDLTERIYLAHEKAWKEFGGSDYIDFVKTQFF